MPKGGKTYRKQGQDLELNQKLINCNPTDDEININVNYSENIDNSLLDSYFREGKQKESSELELSEVKKMLNYKDIRSVMAWCRKHSVYILSQGNRQVVNRVEFLIVYYTPFIQYLKGKYKDWKEKFVHYLNGDIQALIPDMGDNTTRSKYAPKTETEKSFLKKMKKL